MAPENKEKERLAEQKSREYRDRVAANKEAAAIKLELQAMASEDKSIVLSSDTTPLSIRYGLGYKKLGKRAACLKLLRQ